VFLQAISAQHKKSLIVELVKCSSNPALKIDDNDQRADVGS
jgi:hypothetical protein